MTVDLTADEARLVLETLRARSLELLLRANVDPRPITFGHRGDAEAVSAIADRIEALS